MKNNKKGTKFIVYNVIISLMAMTFSVGVGSKNAKAAAESTLYFSPSSTSVTVSSDFTMTAMIDTGTNAVSVVDMYITYDQTKISLTSIACSDTFPLELGNSIPSPQDGTAYASCSVSLDDPSVTTAAGEVAVFSFSALTSNVTNSSITFTDESLAGADDEGGDVIATITGATVTITGASTRQGDNDSKKKKASPKRHISQSRRSVVNGQMLTERGSKFSKNSIVLLYFSKYGGGYYPPVSIRTAKNGSFVIKYKVNKPNKGTYTWHAVDTKTGKKSNTEYYRVKK